MREVRGAITVRCGETLCVYVAVGTVHVSRRTYLYLCACASGEPAARIAFTLLTGAAQAIVGTWRMARRSTSQ